jgi:hypothetical protein
VSCETRTNSPCNSLAVPAPSLAREVLLPYQDMAALNSTRAKPKQKKKSAPPRRKRRPRAERKAKTARGSKVVPAKELSPAIMGRMERTRRLLLAALRVWELKRRLKD